MQSVHAPSTRPIHASRGRHTAGGCVQYHAVAGAGDARAPPGAPLHTGHFNYRAARDRLPAVADGTPWIVLRVPHERDGQTLTAEYDADAQRFRPRVATNSPRLRYLPESLCVIDDATARPMTSPRHAACEIDDMLLRQLSAATGLPSSPTTAPWGTASPGATPLARLSPCAASWPRRAQRCSCAAAVAG